MARVTTSGMVKTHWIGQSAAKLLRAPAGPTEKVQRLSGSGGKAGDGRPLKIESSRPERVPQDERPNQPGAWGACTGPVHVGVTVRPS